MSSELRVLVVDDHPVNRHLLTEIFRHLGCTVATAESGLEALAASSVERFDLICLDRHMPGIGGDDVVCGLPSDQFVLAWSTDDRNLPTRFNGTLAKPVTIPAVHQAMARARAWQTSMARHATTLPHLTAA